MIIGILLTASLGWFFSYVYFSSFAKKSIQLGRRSWIDCVGLGALVFANCATLMINVFVTEISMWVTFLLWPVFVLALDPGYRIAKMQAEALDTKAGDDQKDTDSTQAG